ncbi:MAG: Mu transposase C-terminal domain-containing protein [Cyclobacteriaceae bacterium]|jgi:putative transposase
MAIRPGESLLYQGAAVRILRLVDLDTVEVFDTKKKTFIVSRKALLPIPEETDGSDTGDVLFLSEKEFELASKRYDIIQKMIDCPGDGSIVRETSKANNIPITTLYRWARAFRQAGSIEALIEGRGKSIEGKKLIDPVLEEIITTAIQTKYLTKTRKSITKVIEEVNLKCKLKKLTPPHENTVRNRIRELDEREVLSKRKGKDKAKDQFDPRIGSFPDPVHALQIVQIDHTPVDLIVVDPIHRLPIVGRPILTTAMDIVTRMIVGYYLSFFKPGFVSAGLCISHAILPKDETLKRLKIKGDWPCWGKMAILYMDNAKEFRGHSMARACKKHLIHTAWRPRKNPRFGGHIESFQKTLNQELHNLPGSTFFDVEHRDNYDSQKMASLTFEELEAYIVNFIVNKYHIRVHPKLNRPPIAVWKEQIVGTDEIPGIGFQDEPKEEDVKIGFLPSFVRTIQNYGVSHEGITYYSNSLKPFIKRQERGRGKKLKEYEFRWDPRNLSFIYLLHPINKNFERIDLAKIQYRHANANIWEYKAMMRALKDQGVKEVDEDRIFQAIITANEIEQRAIDQKSRVRSDHKKAKKQNSENKSEKVKPQNEEDPFEGIDLDSIQPY